MQDREFQVLLAKYLAGKCSPEERATLEAWYLTYEAQGLQPLSPGQLAEVQQSTAPRPKKVAGRQLRRWVAAAVVLFALAIGVYIYQAQQERGLSVAQLAAGRDVEPGGRRAFLTLADGRRVDLSEHQDGIAVDSLGVSYTDGTLVAGVAQRKGAPVPITMTTPQGGYYRVTLPDGTNVWLNAASSLRYPSWFAEESREVELTGEAFFEVEKMLDSSGGRKPFIVKTPHQTVRVLGTHFNVTAYAEEEAEATTLVEGAVEVKAEHNEKFVRIVPGEQALVRNGSVMTRGANIEQVTAWKNGYFLFDNEPLGSAMQKIAKWYGITVVFEDAMAEEQFYGIIARAKKLSQVLKMLENTKTVRFEVKGNTVYIFKRST